MNITQEKFVKSVLDAAQVIGKRENYERMFELDIQLHEIVRTLVIQHFVVLGNTDWLLKNTFVWQYFSEIFANGYVEFAEN